MEAKEIINQCYKTDSEYNVLKRVNGDTFSIAIACPINLKIVDKKESNNYYTKRVTIDNVMDENCKRVVIHAKAGCGKTTFCKQYTHLSQNSKDFSFNGQVIHIPLRRLKNYSKKNKVYNLIDVFENEFFSQELEGKKLAKEIYSDYKANKDKYLFLLDGLDEVDHDILRDSSHSMHKCLMELLKSSAEHYLIVTTRPYISLKDYKFSLELEIKGLYDSDVEKYINEFVREDLSQEILMYINVSKVANSLMCTPILLDIICICFEEDLLESKVDGEDFKLKIANLFKIIIEMLWRKYLNKKRTIWYDEHMNSEVLNSKMEKDVEFLEKLAFNQNKRNLIQFSREDFTLENPDLIKSFIFQSELVGKKKHVYSFAHFYFQDYFAAKYIIRNIEKQEVIDFIRSNKYEEKFLHVLQFVAGMADINCANNFFDLLEQHPRDLCGGDVHQRLIFYCLNETMLPSSREERLSEEFVIHLKFVYDTKCYFINEFFDTLPFKVLDKLLDWDNCENPGFNKFSVLVLEHYCSLPCNYLFKLFEICEKSYETKNDYNLESCKRIIKIQKNKDYVFNKINEIRLQNPEMWLELLSLKLDYFEFIPDDILSFILSIILEKINVAVHFDLQFEYEPTVENKGILDNYLITLEGFISKSVKVLYQNIVNLDYHLNIIQESVEEGILKCMHASSPWFVDILTHLKHLYKGLKVESATESLEETFKSDLEEELAEILSSGKEICLDRIFKAFQENNKNAKEKILKRYNSRKDLEENHIIILKQLIINSEILDENRIRAVLWLWNQENEPYDLIIHEALNFFIYRDKNSLFFNIQYDLVKECQQTLKLKFYKMTRKQRDLIFEEMYKFLSNDCNYVVYDEWVNFLIYTLTLEDLQKAILYLFEHKIPILRVSDLGKLCNKVPINLFGKLIAIFNNDFEILNTMTNCDQFFHVLLDIMEKQVEHFLTVSKTNSQLLKHICENYEMPEDVILKFLKSSPKSLNEFRCMWFNWSSRFDFLDWFLNYLRQIKYDEDEQILSKMFTNAIFILNRESYGAGLIKTNLTLNIGTEPSFSNPSEKLLKKCQYFFRNPHNDLSIYFRFHSPQEGKKYLQKLIESCEPVNCSEQACVIYKNAILGFVKIEIVPNGKFCIGNFKSFLEKELKNFELVHLDLSENKLTDRDLFNIVPLIKKNTKLESIILSHNEITHTGFLDLLHDIKSEMISLKCLFFDYNKIMLRQKDINCIPEEISNILESVDLSMNFIPKEILVKLTNSQFPIYKSYYNDIHASIFPVKQSEWREEFEGSIALFYKNQWKPSHVFLLIDQINKEIWQRVITKVEITINSNGEVSIRETKITNPKDFVFYIENFKNKKYNCRYALLTKDKFDKLFNKIIDLRSSQNFLDYSLLPYFFGNNCVTIMVEILKEIDIPTNFVISPKRITFSLSTFNYLLGAFVILIISFLFKNFM